MTNEEIDILEQILFNKLMSIFQNFRALDCSDYYTRFEVVERYKKAIGLISMNCGMAISIVVDKKIRVEIFKTYEVKTFYKKVYDLQKGIDNYMELENLIFQFIEEC